MWEKHEEKEEQAKEYPCFGVDETREDTELPKDVNKGSNGGRNY